MSNDEVPDVLKAFMNNAQWREFSFKLYLHARNLYEPSVEQLVLLILVGRLLRVYNEPDGSRLFRVHTRMGGVVERRVTAHEIEELDEGHGSFFNLAFFKRVTRGLLTAQGRRN